MAGATTPSLNQWLDATYTLLVDDQRKPGMSLSEAAGLADEMLMPIDEWRRMQNRKAAGMLGLQVR